MLTDTKRPVTKPLSKIPPADLDDLNVSNSDVELADGRSPLQRFRSFPKRPLTVTDLTSGAWCELQYWYTLSRLPGGKRTRTQAMRQGSKVHQKLEDEVHTTVKVEIDSREDGFGLRLWNFIQGLRTLRETGLTRELEVWGMIDGNLVNGVIDGVSHENPNPQFELKLSQEESDGADQKKMTDFFGSTNPQATKETKKIYLTDVKTRGSLAPVSKTLVRPAKIQLLLYHKFLSDIAAGELDFFKVLYRYGLKPDELFSDTFIAEIGSLHEEIFDNNWSPTPDAAAEDAEHPNSQESVFVKYHSIRELLRLVEDEVALTFPQGRDSMGNMLRIHYIYRDDGTSIDMHDFPVSRTALETYLTAYMAWWRGERKARGVEIEEAFKCRTCEFVDDCDWRQTKDKERIQAAATGQSTRRQKTA